MAQFYLGLIKTLQRYKFNYRSRQQLALLDGDALRDIGVSYEDAKHEAGRPFWKGSRRPVINSVSYESDVPPPTEKALHLIDPCRDNIGYAHGFKLDDKITCAVDYEKTG